MKQQQYCLMVARNQTYQRSPVGNMVGSSLSYRYLRPSTQLLSHGSTNFSGATEVGTGVEADVTIEVDAYIASPCPFTNKQAAVAD